MDSSWELVFIKLYIQVYAVTLPVFFFSFFFFFSRAHTQNTPCVCPCVCTCKHLPLQQKHRRVIKTPSLAVSFLSLHGARWGVPVCCVLAPAPQHPTHTQPWPPPPPLPPLRSSVALPDAKWVGLPHTAGHRATGIPLKKKTKTKKHSFMVCVCTHTCVFAKAAVCV